MHPTCDPHPTFQSWLRLCLVNWGGYDLVCRRLRLSVTTGQVSRTQPFVLVRQNYADTVAAKLRYRVNVEYLFTVYVCTYRARSYCYYTLTNIEFTALLLPSLDVSRLTTASLRLPRPRKPTHQIATSTQCSTIVVHTSVLNKLWVGES